VERAERGESRGPQEHLNSRMQRSNVSYDRITVE